MLVNSKKIVAVRYVERTGYQDIIFKNNHRSMTQRYVFYVAGDGDTIYFRLPPIYPYTRTTRDQLTNVGEFIFQEELPKSLRRRVKTILGSFTIQPLEDMKTYEIIYAVPTRGFIWQVHPFTLYKIQIPGKERHLSRAVASEMSVADPYLKKGMQLCYYIAPKQTTIISLRRLDRLAFKHISLKELLPESIAYDLGEVYIKEHNGKYNKVLVYSQYVDYRF